MAHNYIVSLQKATAVSACVSGNFTSPTDINLLVAKSSRIEIYLVTPEGLRPLKEVGIYGRVTIMKKFRPPDATTDRVFIVTSRYNAMILECEMVDDKLQVITKAHGSVADRIGQPVETGMLAVIDPKARVIGMRLYYGIFTIIFLNNDSVEIKVTNLRVDDCSVEDIEFLYGCSTPTLIFIRQYLDGRVIETLEINLREKEFEPLGWLVDDTVIDASMLIPVPTPPGGAIIFNQESIVYHDGINYVAVAPPVNKQSVINCYARVDTKGLRYLLANECGNLFMLLLECEEKPTTSQTTGQVFVKDMKVELLGEISIPECITYLDNGVIFVGSRHGDSQLVKLNTVADDSGSYVSVLETFTNIGPILDMCIIDSEHQSQKKIVTCSGSFKDGSLRVIRYGNEIKEKACIDLPDIKGMWSLKVGIDDGNFDNTLVLSSVEHTRILTINGEEVEETEIPGFLSDQQTLLCANVCNSQILQVTPICARLISCGSKQVVSEWKEPSGKRINLVAANLSQVVCALAGDIYYIEITKGELTQRSMKTLEFEVACLDIYPLEDNDTRSDLIAVGLWNDISVRILSLPDLKEICKEVIGGEVIPRSILMTNFEGINYLLCALGDGTMHYFTLNKDSGDLLNQKKIILGTKTIILCTFKSLSKNNVFACSDLPTVICSSNHNLTFSNVNLNEVTHMCSLNAEAYPDCLALATKNSVIIGTIDVFPKIHIRSVPLGETATRIAHQEATQTIGVITIRKDIQDSTGLVPVRQSASTHGKNVGTSGMNANYGQEFETYNLLIIDQNTFKVLDVHQFIQTEYVLSLASAKLGDDANTYFLVGTGFVLPRERQPKQGRIIIYHYTNGKLNLVAERQVNGACYSLMEFNGKVLACINASVRLYEWTSKNELQWEDSLSHAVIPPRLALHIKTKGEFILVGYYDGSRSLFQYNKTEKKLEPIADGREASSLTAIEIVDNDYFLQAEERNNLFICQKEIGRASFGGEHVMTKVAQFHLDDMVNVLRHGSSVKQNIDKRTTQTSGCILFGTVRGCIGIITQLPPDIYELLRNLEERLTKTIQSVGKVDRSHWRDLDWEIQTEPYDIFIDGDLIEQLLELDEDNMREVLKGLQIATKDGGKRDCTVEDIVKIVEELTGIHLTFPYHQTSREEMGAPMLDVCEALSHCSLE